MDINGKIHCFFEQSGTFKNEFKKLGYQAFDYDIQNNFNQTDFIIDLFYEIGQCYSGFGSIFNNITPDDLILAFFPCVYFETIQQLCFCLAKNGIRDKSKQFQINYALERLEKRTEYHKILYKLAYIAIDRNLRLIIENPATQPNYLITGQNFPPPTMIDKNRMDRGDYFKKPTAYWYFNCEPTYGSSFQHNKDQKIITDCERSKGDGLCSEERSAISPDYARNFICDFIIGQKQDIGQLSLF